MRYLLVSIQDRAIDAFQPIACVRAEGEAIRSFQDAINNTNNAQLHAHPDDFDLYIVGHFNDETGELTPTNPPKQLALGKQLKLTRE